MRRADASNATLSTIRHRAITLEKNGDHPVVFRRMVAVPQRRRRRSRGEKQLTGLADVHLAFARQRFAHCRQLNCVPRMIACRRLPLKEGPIRSPRRRGQATREEYPNQWSCRFQIYEQLGLC